MRIVLVAVVVLALLGSVHIAYGAYGPLPGRSAQQSLVDELEAEIADGAAVQAQARFPEGAFFLHVMTGIAQARLGGSENLDRARRHLGVLGDADMLGRFGDGMIPEHGVFASGWTLELATDIAVASESDADVEAVTRAASRLAAAFRQSPTPYLASYPDQYWPCDSVVAIAALARAAELPGVAPTAAERWRAAVAQWHSDVADVTPAGELLPHRVDADGRTVEGPRGSSQAIIQTFWPIIADDHVGGWQRFVADFVTREAGLVGVREHPAGSTGVGDVDSGPLILGVSLSATTVTLGAALANGDRRLAGHLAHEAEVFGIPSRIGPRRYAFGLLPIGEAFLAFAASRTPASEQPPEAPPRSRTPLWPVWWVPGVVVAVIAAAGLRRSLSQGGHRPPRSR